MMNGDFSFSQVNLSTNLQEIIALMV